MQHRGIGLITPVGHTDVDGITYDAFAEVQADYDDSTGVMTITRDLFLRAQGVARLGRPLVLPWLPTREVDRQPATAEAAPEIARSVFREWCATVRESLS